MPLYRYIRTWLNSLQSNERYDRCRKCTSQRKTLAAKENIGIVADPHPVSSPSKERENPIQPTRNDIYFDMTLRNQMHANAAGVAL